MREWWATLRFYPPYLASLKSLFGATSVTITKEGAISLTTIDQKVHLAQLDPQLTSGPGDDLLTVRSVQEDRNFDDINDFEIICPDGNRQTIYYFGMATWSPPGD